MGAFRRRFRHEGHGGTDCLRWVRLHHTHLGLICIDDSRCPALLDFELSSAMAPCFVAMMMTNSPQKLYFDGQTHKKLCVKFESFNISSHVDHEYSSSQPIS